MLARPDVSTNPSLLPRGVRRALDAMRENVGRDWSVTDLAEAAGLSSRSLQRQFRACLGKSPATALRDIRFACARRELLQCLPDIRVMDVALRCGFPHFGRFSVEYRRRYGETPSQTRQRQAVFIGALASVPAFQVSGRDRPTIALSATEVDAEHREIASHITEELATALGRAGVAVVNQPRSARYHLASALRATAGQPRLNFRLIEAETGRHLWAHRADGALGDNSAPNEHLATRIAAALQPSLRLAEIERAQRKSDDELSPNDLALRAMPDVLSLDADGNARAIDLLQKALARDPGHALATALAAWAHAQRVTYHFTSDIAGERARSTELAHKARALTGDATSLAVLGNAFTLLHDLETADLIIRKALAVDGGSAWAWSRSEFIDLYKGEPESAIERFKIALDLAPHESFAFNSLFGIGLAHLEAGRYPDAARWQECALMEHPSALWVHRTLVPAYMFGGAEHEARRSVAALREEYPDLTLTGVVQGMPPLAPTSLNLVLDALKTGGLPL